MSRRYDFAMNKPKKRRKKTLGMEGLDLHSFGINKGGESEQPETSVGSAAFPTAPHEWPDLPPTEDSHLLDVMGIQLDKKPSQLGEEFGSIKDRISKLLTDYESMYDQPDDEGNLFTIEDSVTGQLAIENLMADYRSLCREREDLLESLQDSLDVDEDEILDELEAMRNQSQVDVDAMQDEIKATFKNVHTTSDRLQAVNKKIVQMSKEGKATERLAKEKDELERELQMYKKLAVQQKREFIHPRRASISRGPVLGGEGSPWKMVAGEMVDILKSVRQDGKIDREALERELNRVLLTLNQQAETIDGMKRDMQKKEKSARELEREKNRIFNEKLMLDDELDRRKVELKQCKKYLKEVVREKKEIEGKISFEGGEINLEDEVEEQPVGLRAPVEGGKAHAELLQAQIRDARAKIFKLEEENRDLQRQMDLKMKEKTQTKVEVRRKSSVKLVTTSGSCPNCETYKARLVNLREEQQEAEETIERLKNDNQALRVQLKTSQKETEDIKLLLEKLKKQEPKVVEAVITEASTKPSSKEDQETSSPEKSPEPKETTDKTKQEGPKKLEPPKTSKKRKKSGKRSARKTKSKKGSSKEQEATAEPGTKSPPARDDSDRLVLGECREEKAAYMKVREAKMLHLCDKGTQTTYYGRLRVTRGEEGSGTRDTIGGYRRHARRNSLAASVLAGVNPDELGHETVTAQMMIQEEIDRLCEDISGFVEFGLELVSQEAKCLHIKAETQLGTEKAAEILGSDYTSQGTGKHKSLKWPDHRRVSVSSHGRRKSSILQQDMRTKADKRRTSSMSEPKEPLHEHEDEPKTTSGKQESDTEGLMQQVAPQETGPTSDGGGSSTEKSSAPLQLQSGDEKIEGQKDSSTSDHKPCLETDPGIIPRIQITTHETETGSDETQVSTKASHGSKWLKSKNFFSVLKTMKGGGCSHLHEELQEAERSLGDVIPSAEDQLKKQVTVMARHALELIQSTGSLVTSQLNLQLGAYDRFFQYWHDVRESKKEEMGKINAQVVPVEGTKLTSTAALQDRSGKLLKPEDKSLEMESKLALPHLHIAQQPSFTGRKSAAIATAGLSTSGMMMISGGGIRSTASTHGETHGSSQVKKRVKPSRKSSRYYQPIPSQKSIIERVLNVSNEMDNIQNMLASLASKQNAVKHRGAPHAGETKTAIFSIGEAQPYTLPSISMKSFAKPKAQENAKTKDSLSHRTHQTQPREAPANPPPNPSAVDLLPGLLQFSLRKEKLEVDNLPGTVRAPGKTWERRTARAPPEREFQSKSNEATTKFPVLSVSGGMWKVS